MIEHTQIFKSWSNRVICCLKKSWTLLWHVYYILKLQNMSLWSQRVDGFELRRETYVKEIKKNADLVKYAKKRHSSSNSKLQTFIGKTIIFIFSIFVVLPVKPPFLIANNERFIIKSKSCHCHGENKLSEIFFGYCRCVMVRSRAFWHRFFSERAGNLKKYTKWETW